MDGGLDYSYTQTMGVTGMAFGLLWAPGWRPGNSDIMSIADPDEIVGRAFPIQRLQNRDHVVGFYQASAG